MLATISWIALGIGILSSIIIAIDVWRHPQMMKIMNIVWPINGWFLGPIALWTYFKWGRLKAKDNEQEDDRGKGAKVFFSTSHCSSGCSFGDAVGVPIVAITGITIAGSTLFAHYAVEFILAYGFGIIFQYFAIHPMSENNSKWDSIRDSIKADSLSLIAFEVGMFGWMAIVHYLLFTEPPVPSEATYWFMMQIAMILGFMTSYPANWWLVQKGIKEEM
ncbi:DUF4396 domain-containing protein [Salimicrobium halophilum]|uniref:DUF4396 domain-containing protein n=1 Tax=Salimicrobium halophilum TaxID=86666 RepID=A0A1G8WLN7_9BACI|nr:DUF4396 domain-containing protein [Salimicrobium halophilum]SDJ78963.1 protein of unknown function [Salimicrobium halophilum]